MHSTRFALLAPVLLLIAACGPTGVSSNGVTLALAPVTMSLTPTPTLKPPTIHLPALKGSTVVGWPSSGYGGFYSADSCSVLAKLAVHVAQPVNRARAELVAKMRRAGYVPMPNGDIVSTGPGYSVTTVRFTSPKHPRLQVALSFGSVPGSAARIGYWATEVMQPKLGSHCVGLRG